MNFFFFFFLTLLLHLGGGDSAHATIVANAVTDAQHSHQNRAANSNSVVADGTLQFANAVRVIPHPQKAKRGGEDAFFAHPFAIGVADGVGGWNLGGVDPSQYSRALVAGALGAAETNQRDPTSIMYAGYNEARGIVGSATFCIVALDTPASAAAAAVKAAAAAADKSASSSDKDNGDNGARASVAQVRGPTTAKAIGVLRSANLGDSGFMLYRHGALVYRSKEQQHDFNFPFQLGEGSDDTPAVATTRTLSVEPGDVVIVGSDGLFDNVHEESITALVGVHTNIDELAERLARIASLNANNMSFMSPFAVNALRYGYDGMIGGKLDDITVVVGQVRRAPTPPRKADGGTHGTSVTGKDGQILLGVSTLLIVASDDDGAVAGAGDAAGLLGLVEVSNFWTVAALSAIAMGLWQCKRTRARSGATTARHSADNKH